MTSPTGTDERVAFDALEYRADDTFARVRLGFRSSPGGGWQVEREGAPHLELGPGYRLVRTRTCGVCSTDLDRRFLPFALPQVIGHEVVVEDEAGHRCVVEINASDHALGSAAPCAFCRAGLDTHCPDRVVLGIHDLPGGFGPWLLAPRRGLLEVPDAVPDSTAALIEPFAAALHAVSTVDPQPGSTVAVLGPRRLGLLVIAALAAHRRATGSAFEILALARRPELRELAVALGADRADAPPADSHHASPICDVVIDTTGSPDGLELACALARVEVHLKSTHGQTALDCAHMTEAVVDELSLYGIHRDDDDALLAAIAETPQICAPGRVRVGWLSGDEPPARLPEWIEIQRGEHARPLLERLESEPSGDGAAAGGDTAGALAPLPRVDAMIVDDTVSIDEAIRPIPDREVSPLRPRGRLIVGSSAPSARAAPEQALRAVLGRGLRISTSRCGDFRSALALIAGDAVLRDLGLTLVTHRFGPRDLALAFRTARSSDAIKVLVEHSD